MIRILAVLLLAGLLGACADQSQSPPLANRLPKGPFIYSDSSEAFFRVLRQSPDSGWHIRKQESTYQIAYIAFKEGATQHYLAKYTTLTDSWTGSETQDRTIKVRLSEIQSPAKSLLEIEENCDELVLENQYYKAIKYGCCGGPTQIKFYDYNNQLLIEGQGNVVLASVPNKFTFYLAFQPSEQDSLSIGMLNLSYNSQDVYRINVKTRYPASTQCKLMIPTIRLRTTNKRDVFNKQDNEYSLWSLERISSPEGLDKLAIEVSFPCDETLSPITIPIVKGKPFGKSQRIQEYLIKN